MNIGIVTTWFERGAAYVSRQYRDLLASDHQVFIYARGGERSGRGDPTWDDARVTWGSDIGPYVATYVDRRSFLQWLERSRPEVVFFNEQHFWLPVSWCSAAGIKTGAYIDYYTENTIDYFAAYDFLVCNTRRHFSAFDWHEQAFHIPWGTNPELFKPKHLDLVERDKVVFFHSAGMNPKRKGTEETIRAFTDVRGPAKLVVHAQVSLRSEFPGLAGVIDSMSRDGRLQIIESTVSAPGLYHLGDVYVYPSRLDGIGLTIAEALACGLPVIIPDQPPMNEFVKPGEDHCTLLPVARQYARADGYYWPQCRIDLNDLTQAMQAHVDSRSTLRNRKEAARRHACRELDWSSRREAVLSAFRGSRILTSDRKKEALEIVVKYEYSRIGGELDMWMKYPRLYRAVLRTSSALRSTRKPFSRFVRRMLKALA